MSRSGRSYTNRAIIVAGATAFDQTITCTGIASAEAFGTPNVVVVITPTGIPSGEAFGSTTVQGALSPTGIPSGEAFGSPVVSIQQFITVTGIPSAEAFGSPSLQLGYPQSLTMIGIPSEQAFGFPTVANRSVQVLTPNTVQETPAGRNILHIRYGIDRGISIIKRQDGTYYETRYPAQVELEQALKYYLGGYRHLLTPDEAADLTAHGFGSLIHLEPVPQYQGA